MRQTKKHCRRILRKLEKNIQAAVEIARDAVNGRDAWIAGDIGLIPVNGAEDAAAAADEYYQIAKTFAERGVTVLDFETFRGPRRNSSGDQKICAEYEMFIMVSLLCKPVWLQRGGTQREAPVSGCGGCSEDRCGGLKLRRRSGPYAL